MSFADATMTASPGDTLIQTASKVGAVAGDNREETYRVDPMGQGVTVDRSSGEVIISSSATERAYTITAELQEDEKYTRATATYTVELRAR